MIADFETLICSAFATAATAALANLAAPPQVVLYGDDTDMLSARVEINAEVVGGGEEPTDAMVYRYMRQATLYVGVLVPKMTRTDIGVITTRLRNVVELSHKTGTGTINATLLTSKLAVAGTPLQTGMQRMMSMDGDFPMLQVIMTYEFPLFYNYAPPPPTP